MRQPDTLPPLPAAHARALEMLSRHDAEPAELTSVVEGDPALTAAVMRAGNSAASAPRDPLRTAQEAVIRIGLAATRRIIAGAALRGAFANIEHTPLQMDEMWQHLLSTAMLADAMAWAQGPRTQAFTAGLLHDIGRLAMASQEPERYEQVFHLIRDGAEPMEAEHHVFGTDHAAWGAEVGAGWRLPDDITEVIGTHHGGDDGALSWVTYHGRELAGRLGIGDGVFPGREPEEDLGADDEAVLEMLGGFDEFWARIEWYRGAITSAAA